MSLLEEGIRRELDVLGREPRYFSLDGESSRGLCEDKFLKVFKSSFDLGYVDFAFNIMELEDLRGFFSVGDSHLSVDFRCDPARFFRLMKEYHQPLDESITNYELRITNPKGILKVETSCGSGSSTIAVTYQIGSNIRKYVRMNF